MPDLPILSAGVFVLVFGGLALAAALLDASREVVILSAAALIGIGVFLVRRGLATMPWDEERARRRRRRAR